MFSLNALDPKLVWHIEKETKEGFGGGGQGRDGRGEEARMDTEKSRVKEEHRNSEKDTGKEVETEKGRQGKQKKIPTPPKKRKILDLKGNEFRSPRKGVGEETKTLPSLYRPSWGGVSRHQVWLG